MEPSADGQLAFVAYWDSGFVALDLSDPENPTYLGDTDYGADEDGDAHSSQWDEAREILFSADEDFCKTSGPDTEKGFGYLRAWDYSDLSDPVQIGEYRTPNSSGSKDVRAGDYTIHNPLIVGTDLYISWYTDGIRVVNAADPRNLREVAYFVPPSAKNPVQPSQRGHAHERDPGLGRRSRRRQRPGLRERHELRALDRAEDGPVGPAGWRTSSTASRGATRRRSRCCWPPSRSRSPSTSWR